MPIRVLCSDKCRGFVEDCDLDDLMRRGIVVAFFRPGSNQWLNAKNNYIRKKRALDIKGWKEDQKQKYHPSKDRICSSCV